MKILINYANPQYQKAQRWNSWTGVHVAGFDKVFAFSPDDIDQDYIQAHLDIFSQKRGNGLWLWKPYFINKVMSQCNDGDIIFYADSGAFFVKKVDKLLASLRENEKIWVSDCPLLESCFTKPSCLYKMDCNCEAIRDSNQIQATYLFLICCDETRAFVKKWLSFCEDYELLSAEGGLDLNAPRGNGFVAHREDQSILSLLCKLNNIKPHKDPSQRGRYPETFFNPYYSYRVPDHDDTYGTVLFLHKAGNPNLLTCAKTILRTARSVLRYRSERRKL